jgi:agmatinase
MKNKPFRELLTEDIKKADCILTGIPYDKGCSVGKGARFAPKRIRELSGCLPAFTKDGVDLRNFKIYDNGDIVKFDKLEKEMNKLYDMKPFKLFIGGDHSVSIPLQKAFIENSIKNGKTPVIIHIDAHPDILDFYDGSKMSHACTNKRAIDNGLMTSNLVMLGIRGFEAYEVTYLKQHPEIEVYTSTYVNKEGIDGIIKKLKKRFDNDLYEIYLSYDIDANDPAFAPGTGTPEHFGVDSKDILKFVTNIISSLNVKAMDIVEVSPTLDINNMTSWLVLKTLLEVFEILKK